MIFDSLMIEEAEGAILAHTLRLSGRVLKKGQRLNADDLEALAATRRTHVTAARLEASEVHEDQAAAEIAQALGGIGARATAAFTGRCNLVSEEAGVLILDEDAVRRLNQTDEAITVATLPAFATVRPRQVVATVKIIPFGVAGEKLRAATEPLAHGNAIKVAAFQPMRVAALVTRLPGSKDSLIEKTERILGDRLRTLGVGLLSVDHCRHEIDAVSERLSWLIGTDCDLVVIAGAAAIMDRRDVIPAAIEQVGGRIERFGMPVDPGNLLLLGRVGNVTVIGMPGCARSIKENGFDWVLARVTAGLPVTSEDIAAMGVGGLLEESFARTLPRDVAVESEEVERRAVAGEQRRIGAIVLAAGRSRRMGDRNKLLATIDGVPLVRLAVDAALRSKATSVTVVTGHEADAVELVLSGLEVRIVRNKDHEAGMSSSLRSGLAALPPDLDGAVVCLADMPYVNQDHIDRLIEAFEPEADRAICVATHAGRRGNPVLWARHFFDDLKTLSGDIGGRKLLQKHADYVVEVEMKTAGVLRDIDRPEDLI